MQRWISLLILPSAASLRTRPWCDQAHNATKAVIGLTPAICRRSGRHALDMALDECLMVRGLGSQGSSPIGDSLKRTGSRDCSGYRLTASAAVLV